MQVLLQCKIVVDSGALLYSTVNNAEHNYVSSAAPKYTYVMQISEITFVTNFTGVSERNVFTDMENNFCQFYP